MTDFKKKYGNQSIIQSVDCKKILKDNIYTVMGSSGTENLLQNPIEFSLKALEKGAGEIMINSIDNDGSLMGYDLDLIKLVSNKINCPKSSTWWVIAAYS